MHRTYLGFPAVVVLAFGLLFYCSGPVVPECQELRDLRQSTGLGQPALPSFSLSKVPVYGYELVRAYDHDPQAFTQGLAIDGEHFIEGTGLEGESTVRRVALTGRVVQSYQLPNSCFGEGVTVWRDRVIQLTWRSGLGLVYEKKSLEKGPIKEFRYATEGWGLTHDEKNLIMSDGTAKLYFIDPDSFQVVKQLEVRYDGQPIHWLNELELVKGEVWANIWYEDRIARIDPGTGKITAWVDLTDLRKAAGPDIPKSNVLNGIAYDAQSDRIFVTGKNWPKLFEIRVLPK
jgi:glutamine cyclotransferase